MSTHVNTSISTVIDERLNSSEILDDVDKLLIFLSTTVSEYFEGSLNTYDSILSHNVSSLIEFPHSSGHHVSILF